MATITRFSVFEKTPAPQRPTQESSSSSQGGYLLHGGVSGKHRFLQEKIGVPLEKDRCLVMMNPGKVQLHPIRKWTFATQWQCWKRPFLSASPKNWNSSDKKFGGGAWASFLNNFPALTSWNCECSQVKICQGSRILHKFSLASTVVAKGTTGQVNV